MGEVVATASQPALAAIKLAWWRDALCALDAAPAPAEPRLRTAAAELLPRGLTGAELSGLAESWTLLLHHDDADAVLRGIGGRGQRLFALAARLIDVPMDAHLNDAAQSFAAADVARRGLVERLEPRTGRPIGPSPRSARPLTALAALARRDMRMGGPPFEPEATPGRAWTLIRHRIVGR